MDIKKVIESAISDALGAKVSVADEWEAVGKDEIDLDGTLAALVNAFGEGAVFDALVRVSRQAA